MTIRTPLKWLATVAVGLALPFTVAAKDLRLGVITPPSHQWAKSAAAFAEDVAKETDGRLKVLVFPSGQLGTEAQMLQQMQSGALDLAFLAAGEVANRRPNYGALFAPFLVSNPEEAHKLLQGPTANALLDELKSVGLVGLGFGMAGMRQIVMRNKVESLSDIAGRKIRTMPVEPERDFWIKIGAAPTPIPLPALYDGFANGQVDGMQIDYEGTWNTRYVDLAGTVISSDHMMLPMVAVASGRNWRSLSAEDQELVTRLMRKHLDEIITAYEQLDEQYLAEIKGSGANVIEVDRAFFGPGVDAWYEEWRKKSPALAGLEAEAAAIKQQQQ